MRRTISSYHPALYTLRVWQKQQARHLRDWPQRHSFAREVQTETLPHVLKRHQSLLNRKMGDSDPQLQLNKIVNLRLALKYIDGILIRPGETLDLLQKSPTIAMLAGLTPSSNLWAKRKPRLEEGVSPAH